MWTAKGDDDAIEIESSTDRESNRNSENQSEAENAKNSLNATNDTSENEAKQSEQENTRGQEKANQIAEGGGNTSLKPKEYTGKKTAEKNSKTKESTWSE